MKINKKSLNKSPNIKRLIKRLEKNKVLIMKKRWARFWGVILLIISLISGIYTIFKAFEFFFDGMKLELNILLSSIITILCLAIIFSNRSIRRTLE